MAAALWHPSLVSETRRARSSELGAGAVSWERLGCEVSQLLHLFPLSLLGP